MEGSKSRPCGLKQSRMWPPLRCGQLKKMTPPGSFCSKSSMKSKHALHWQHNIKHNPCLYKASFHWRACWHRQLDGCPGIRHTQLTVDGMLSEASMAFRRAIAFCFMAALVAALSFLMASPTWLAPASCSSSSRLSAKGPMVEPLLTASS